MNKRNFDLSWYRPTNAHTNTHTHTHKRNARRTPVANTQTGPITILCAAKLSAQCNEWSEYGFLAEQRGFDFW